MLNDRVAVSNGNFDPSEPVHDSSLLSDLVDGVLTLTLNRPDRLNALDAELGLRLLTILTSLPNDHDVHCVVLTGSGRGFCSGDDVATLDAWSQGQAAHEAPALPGTQDAYYLRIVEALITCGKPVIAAINGVSAGAGTEMLCAADYRIAADSARIGSCLVNVAQIGNAVMLPRLVGTALATDLYISGRLLTAEEALRAGLVNQVVPKDHLQETARELALQWARKPTRAIALFKELRDRALCQPVEHALRLQDLYHQRGHREIADETEGLRAFVEKRPAEFTGR